ncbi:hypothetical protein HDU76_001830 [Blyttiomyces sp. JEL0837]|nr:hypothetical protein HDU76_001830 [Blyttiomyces sp. JEL0837]
MSSRDALREHCESIYQGMSDMQQSIPKGKLIGIHDTFSYNISGFMVVSYLVSELGWNVHAAMEAFKKARNPGIYERKYIDDLYSRFNDTMPLFATYPLPPEWDTKARDRRVKSQEQSSGFAIPSLPTTKKSNGGFAIPSLPAAGPLKRPNGGLAGPLPPAKTLKSSDTTIYEKVSLPIPPPPSDSEEKAGSPLDPVLEQVKHSEQPSKQV